MDYLSEAARLLHISPNQVCLSIFSAAFVGAVYAARKPLYKKLADTLHEMKHRNFFDEFARFKDIAGKKSYPRTRWIKLKIGKKVVRRGYLEISNLFAESQDIRLGEWSTEFKRIFRLRSMTGPGQFLLTSDILGDFKTVHEEDISHCKSSKECLSIGLQEDGLVCRIPTFTSLDGHTRIASKSGHGKTFLIARMVAEAQRHHPHLHCLLITSKGAGIIGRIAPSAFEWLNPSYDLEAIRDRLKETLEDAYARLKKLEEARGETSDEPPVLLVVDEARDILTVRTGKPGSPEEALKQEITNMLEQVAAKMRSVNYHLIVASQQASSSDYPQGLRDNISNMIVGNVDNSYFPVLLKGIDQGRFEETLNRGDWWISTSIQGVKKVRIVQQSLSNLPGTTLPNSEAKEGDE